VQFEFELNATKRSSDGPFLALGGRLVPVVFVHNHRARRYVLRLRTDGSARVTVPRGGTVLEARKFAERNTRWLERALQRLAARPARPEEWRIGTEIYFRGALVRIEPEGQGSGRVRFADEILKADGCEGNLRGIVERHLWRLASRELPPRVFELAALHRLTVNRVTVRNQRSRWGSCSRRGTISLNWRIIQAPQFVCDYLILHELMHLRQMNHSARYWREVESVCPDYQMAERWLKQHSTLLR